MSQSESRLLRIARAVHFLLYVCEDERASNYEDIEKIVINMEKEEKS